MSEKIALADVQAALVRLAQTLEEHDSDPNHVMPIYHVRKQHDRMHYLAPEQWLAFHRVMARRALAVYVRELLTWTKNVVFDDFSNKRQIQIIAEIRRIVHHDLGQPESKTVQALDEYERVHLVPVAAPKEEVKS